MRSVAAAECDATVIRSIGWGVQCVSVCLVEMSFVIVVECHRFISYSLLPSPSIRFNWPTFDLADIRKRTLSLGYKLHSITMLYMYNDRRIG